LGRRRRERERERKRRKKCRSWVRERTRERGTLLVLDRSMLERSLFVSIFPRASDAFLARNFHSRQTSLPKKRPTQSAKRIASTVSLREAIFLM
jgi:hypothetical protein